MCEQPGPPEQNPNQDSKERGYQNRSSGHVFGYFNLGMNLRGEMVERGFQSRVDHLSHPDQGEGQQQQDPFQAAQPQPIAQARGQECGEQMHLHIALGLKGVIQTRASPFKAFEKGRQPGSHVQKRDFTGLKAKSEAHHATDIGFAPAQINSAGDPQLPIALAVVEARISTVFIRF